jgi:hypothetical protein
VSAFLWDRRNSPVRTRSRWCLPSQENHATRSNGCPLDDSSPSKQVTELNTSRKEQSHRWPVFLADRKHFLFFVRSQQQPDASGIYAGSLDSKEYQLVVRATAGPAFAVGGAIVYMRDETVWTQAFDQRRLVVSGEPVALRDRVIFNPFNSFAAFSVSPAGDMIYHPARPGGSTALTW